ncbi:putative quinol monooxygenase [Natronomonas marina]|jgi:quinol monooxygenase YgiN|uniref:putative quinol monooxygenase n=1 Tax=Natronomonas marina TaxID=2961939 RepID=UPI0020C9ADFB|nr:putative quinol monooxygenase [Natronomonas marina]
MIVMHAEMPIASDSREAALDLLEELAEQSRAEDGVVDYCVTTDVESPNTVRVVEEYEDADAVDAHMSSDHFESFQADIAAHLAGEPELYRFDVDSKTRVM